MKARQFPKLGGLHIASLFIIIFCLPSCLLFNWVDNIRAKANQCCNFDPSSRVVNFNCGNEKIIFIRIVFASLQPNTSGVIFYESNFDPSTNQITIPKIQDTTKSSRSVIIYLWNANQVIHDYSIEVTPTDWTSGKLIYGHYSYR